MLHFEVECQTTLGQVVAVVGSGPLGNWDVGRCLVLKPTAYPLWVGESELIPNSGAEFKYALVTAETPTPTLIKWEHDGENRRVNPSACDAKAIILHHTFGDPARSSIEVAEKSFPAPAAAHTMTPPTSPGSIPPSSPGSITTGNASVVNAGERDPDPVLDKLQVAPSVRFGRFHHQPGAFEERYILNDKCVLGTGMSGGVCLAQARFSDDQVAVKTLSTQGLSESDLAQVKAEVENQLKLDHPHICRLIEVFEEKGRLRLVMERMRGKDLLDHISSRGRYTEQDASSFVRQILSAVAYCHSKGVCHRDLKLENVCLESDSEDARVKLIDFGLSAMTQNGMPMTAACGTLYYVAPEVFRQMYDKKCDLWSLGVVAYILLDGRPPFNGGDDATICRMIRQGRYSFPPSRWEGISAQAKDFIGKKLRVSPSERPTAQEALNHEWLREAAHAAEDQQWQPLDAGVLRSMQTFSKSNALKRAVIRAIAPSATLERISGWADHFGALDKDGKGCVSMRDLAEYFAERGGVCAPKAEALCATLAKEADDVGGELVSYSAFLAASLSAHVKLDGCYLRSLFDRMDDNKSGTISIDEVEGALGDVVDIEQVKADFQGRELTFTDFRWLMSMPGRACSPAALRRLLRAGGRLTSKVSKRRARLSPDDDETIEAARKDNLAWRAFKTARAGGRGGPHLRPLS